MHAIDMDARATAESYVSKRLQMFYGTYKQHGINASTRSAVTEIPMIWVYGVGYVASIAMALILVGKLVRLIRGDVSEDELVQVKESEEVLAAHGAEVKR